MRPSVRFDIDIGNTSQIRNLPIEVLGLFNRGILT